MTTSTESVSAPAPKPARPQFGRVALPAVGYFQGSRRMVTTVMTPVSLVNAAGERETWDPLHGTGTNRKEDKAHRKGIATYIENTTDYVLGAIIAYINPADAEFVPDDPNSPISAGVLYYTPGLKIIIGDGGHRTSALSDVVDAHREVNDDVFRRMVSNGQPVIIVLDGDRTNRARDFVTLQNNAKPLNQSVAQSMNIDEALNKVLLERVIKGDEVACFDGGKRVEFLTESPGKLSAKIASYKAIRYASGTVLVGTGHRSTKGWAQEVDLAMARAETGEGNPVSDLIEFWQGYSALPAVARALKIDKGIALLRNDTWLTSAYLLYALAAGVHQIRAKSDQSITDIFAVLAEFDFSRAGNALYGTLVDPPTDEAGPRGRTGRDAWEGAGGVLAAFVLDRTAA